MKQFLFSLLFGPVEDFLLDYLTELATKSDNKVDDRLVEALRAALNNESYLAAIKKWVNKV